MSERGNPSDLVNYLRTAVGLEVFLRGAIRERDARYLEEAREAVGERLGAVPAEPMGVVLYGKAAYLRAHRHRFSFQTVGFYDGRIHVVSAAHPAGVRGARHNTIASAASIAATPTQAAGWDPVMRAYHAR